MGVSINNLDPTAHRHMYVYVFKKSIFHLISRRKPDQKNTFRISLHRSPVSLTFRKIFDSLTTERRWMSHTPSAHNRFHRCVRFTATEQHIAYNTHSVTSSSSTFATTFHTIVCLCHDIIVSEKIHLFLFFISFSIFVSVFFEDNCIATIHTHKIKRIRPDFDRNWKKWKSDNSVEMCELIR